MANLDKSVLFKKGQVSIQGMDAVIAAFRELTGNKANAKIAVAMKYAMAPLFDAVKIKAPIKRKGETLGLLKKSIGIKVKTMGRRGQKKVVGMVGPKLRNKLMTAAGRTVKPYLYAHLVERGTAPHSLKARNSTKLKNFVGPVKSRKTINKLHPGAVAKPFMKPALDSTGTQIYTRFCEKIKEIIKSIAEKKGM